MVKTNTSLTQPEVPMPFDCLVGFGRLKDGGDAVEKATKIVPTYLTINASVSWIHLFACDIQGTIKRGEKTALLCPISPRAMSSSGGHTRRWNDIRRNDIRTPEPTIKSRSKGSNLPLH